jgi:hypothetical protein
MRGIKVYDIPKIPVFSSLACIALENVFDHSRFRICIHIPVEMLCILWRIVEACSCHLLFLPLLSLSSCDYFQNKKHTTQHFSKTHVVIQICFMLQSDIC